MKCQLCANEIKDVSTGLLIEPWGETCSDCVEDIKEFGKSRIIY